MPKWAFGWSVGWRVVAPGSLRRLAAAAGRRNGVEGRYTGSLRGQGVCGDCFDPFTHQERLLTARMVVLALLRRLGFWAPWRVPQRGGCRVCGYQDPPQPVLPISLLPNPQSLY